MTNNSYEYDKQILKTHIPLMRYKDGEDVAAWQKRTYDKLWELLGMDNYERADPDFKIEKEEDCDDHHKIWFSFQSEPGYRVPCCLMLPYEMKKYTPVICLQGHSTGMHISIGTPIYPGDAETISGGDRDFAVRAVKEGFAAIAVEQRYMGSCGHKDDGHPACLDGNCLAALLMGRCALGERVWDVMRLIDLLEEKYADRLDLEKLICMGNSGGGTATFYAGCMEKRIKTVMPSCAYCTYKDSIGAMHHCPCNYLPGAAKYFDMGDLAGLVAPRQFIAVAGKEDPIFPIFGVEESFALTKKVFDAAGCAEHCRLVVGNGAHRFYADPAWKMYREVQAAE